MSPTKKLCMVCGDKALGYNFNAITCESCKAFFRRNALLNKKFTCPFNEKCEITAVTRRFCQKCRLEKCFKIGMDKEHIMSEEDKILKKHKIEQNRQKRKLLLQNNDEKKIKHNQSTTKIKHQVNQDKEVNQDSLWIAEKIKVNFSESSNDEQEDFSNTANISCESSSSSQYKSTNETSVTIIENPNIFEKSSINVLNASSSAQDIINSIVEKPETASQIINNIMRNPEEAVSVLSKIINSPTEAMKLISHLISYPGNALKIISKLMNSPLDALSVFTKFMSSPTDTLQIISRIVNSPSDVLNFIQQLMCSPEDATNIMDKFMNTPAEALKIINKMVNKNTNTAIENEAIISSTNGNNTGVINSMLNEIHSPESSLSSPSPSGLDINHKHNNITVATVTAKSLMSSPSPSASSSVLTATLNSFINKSYSLPRDIKPNLIDIGMINDNNVSYSTNSTKSDKMRNIFEDVEDRPIQPNSIESVLCEAIKLEYETFSTTIPQSISDSKELNEAENAKLNELILANKALYLPVDEDLSNLINDDRIKYDGSQQDPKLLHLINLTAVAIRRLIKMSKKISAFKNMCQEDQVALLKGGCTEMMIMRSVMTYDQNKAMWKIPHSKEDMSNIKVDVLKLAKGNVYEEHDRFIRTFEPKWRMDENIILIMCAILLFSPMRPRVIHSDVIKLEQNSYYYLLRRYLESIYPGCEAKSTFIKLIQKIAEVAKLNEVVISVYLNVNPSHIEPLLREIFDLKNH